MVPIAPLVVLFLAAFLYSPVSNDFDQIDGNDPSRVLVLTAHPDDEAMFFAPTILALKANTPRAQGQSDDASGQTVFSTQTNEAHIFSLCLSNGNAEGLGSVREQELSQSLDILGIPANRRLLIDNADLQDNITLHWDPATIASVIKPYILEHGISTILTFDYAGVSDHPNHKALPEGAKHLLKSFPDSSAKPRLFTLISVPKAGKYVSIMAPIMAKVDLYVSKTLLYYDLLIVKGLVHGGMIPEGSKPAGHSTRTLMPVFVSGTSGYKTAFKAMLAHQSQLEWFRWLYLIFSRYMWINEWVEVKA